MSVFCTFWLANVLFATAACNFWFRLWAPTSAPAALTGLLFDWPDTRIIWKNTAFRDFSNIWRGCIFFLLTFWLLHLLSTDLTTLLLLFNSPYCRKFLFKLPSIIVSSKLLKQVRFVGQRKSWWFSFNPCEKVMCVKHGNLPQRGAVEHQKNTFERENSCTMKSSAAPTVHKWHPSRTAPRRCWWTWKKRGPKKLEMTRTVANGALLKFNLYRPWKITWPEVNCCTSMGVTYKFYLRSFPTLSSVVSTDLKNISQLGNLPQVWKQKNIWNDQLV